MFLLFILQLKKAVIEDFKGKILCDECRNVCKKISILKIPDVLILRGTNFIDDAYKLKYVAQLGLYIADCDER